MSFSQPDHAFVVRQHPSAVMDEAGNDGAQIEATIEAVGVFGEIAPGIFGKAEGMVGSRHGGFEIRDERIYPTELGMLSCLPAGTNDDGLVRSHRIGEYRETRQGIRQDVRGRRQRLVGPGVDALMGKRHRVEADVTGPAIVGRFHRRDERHLVLRSTSRLAGTGTAQVGIIDFDAHSQFPVGLRFAHDGHEFVLEQPGRVVADPEVPLQTQGRDVVLGLRHEEHGQEPLDQRQLGVLENRAGGDADLMAAAMALPEPLMASLETGMPVVLASRADEPRRPTLLCQCRFALRFGSVSIHKLGQRQPSLKLNSVLHGRPPSECLPYFQTPTGSPREPAETCR